MNAPAGENELRFLLAIRVPNREKSKTFICQLFADSMGMRHAGFRPADSAGPAVSAG
jgi:hypothetical protein